MEGDVIGVILSPVSWLTSIFYIFILVFIGVALYMFFRIVVICSTRKKSQTEKLHECLYNKKYIKKERDTTLSELNDAIGLKLSKLEQKSQKPGKPR